MWAYGLIANFKPGHQETWVNYRNDARPPLLFIAGGADHIMPPSVNASNAKHYKSNTVTEFFEFEGRSEVLDLRRAGIGRQSPTTRSAGRSRTPKRRFRPRQVRRRPGNGPPSCAAEYHYEYLLVVAPKALSFRGRGVRPRTAGLRPVGRRRPRPWLAASAPQLGSGTIRMYAAGLLHPSGQISFASSFETDPAVITSSPCCQFTA